MKRRSKRRSGKQEGSSDSYGKWPYRIILLASNNTKHFLVCFFIFSYFLFYFLLPFLFSFFSFFLFGEDPQNFPDTDR